MGSAPLWVPLLVAGIAVIGTLSGVVFTQVWNSRLEERRLARENDRLREVQAREDLNRTYEHRRAAYVEFRQEFVRIADLLRGNREPIAHDGPFFDELFNRWTLISVYGTFEADALAFMCLQHLQYWGIHPENGKLRHGVYGVGTRYLNQIRKELGVPEWKPPESPEPAPTPPGSGPTGASGPTRPASGA